MRRRGRWPTAQRSRGGEPTTSATVDVTKAGRPIVASHAASNMSTTGRGQVPAVWWRNSSGESSWNGIRRPIAVPDDANLLGLTEGFGAGEDVVASRVDIVTQGACRDRGDVAFVDRCCLRGRVWPADDLAGSDGHGPPVECVRGEHPWSDRCRGESGFRDQPLNVGMQPRRRIWLLKERMRRLMRRGEEDHSLRVGSQAFDDSWSGRQREASTQEIRRLRPAGWRRATREAVRSPDTTSTADGNRASAGRRVSARTGTSASNNRSITRRPIRPVAPVTRTGSCRAPVMMPGKSKRPGAGN